MILDKVKNYIIVFLTFVASVFAGLAMYNKKQSDSKDEEIDQLKQKNAKQSTDDEVKNFEAIDIERKEHTDEEIHELSDDISDGGRLDGGTYQL